MAESSGELNSDLQRKDQVGKLNNPDKSVEGRLGKITPAIKKVAGKVILGTPIAGLLMSSANIDNPNIPAPNIKEPTPASMPLPENTSHNTDMLQPYTPQASEQKENADHNIAGVEQPAIVELRFKATGIENFLPLYNESQVIKDKYRGDVGWYFSMLTVCDAVAKGEIVDQSDPRLVEVRDGWGSEKEHAVEKALEHVNNIAIEAEGFESYVIKADQPEEVREKLLRPFARSFAPLAKALPNKLVVNPSGAFSHPDFLMITTLNTEAGLNAALPVFWHEVNHSADQYPARLKSLVSKDAYLDYIRSYFQISDELLTQWFSIKEEEKALNFWRDVGGGYGWSTTPIIDEQADKTLLTNLATEYFGKSPDEANNPLFFESITWNTGIKLMAIREKQSNQESLTSQDQTFLKDPRVEKIMSKTLYETIHFLVQPYEDFTVESPEEYDNLPKGFLAIASQRMQEARLAAFATFPVDSNREISSQIRQQFGLKPVAFEKPQ